LTVAGSLWISADPGNQPRATDIGQSVRIGVTSAHEHALRYYLRGSPFVSGPKRLNG
jgi:DNA-3-methyladenine glycosylase